MPNTKPVGVAFSDPELVSGTTITGAEDWRRGTARTRGFDGSSITGDADTGGGGRGRTSPVGSGAVLKLAVNLPLMIYWQALGEALAISRSLNVDPVRLMDMLCETSGGPNVLKVRGPGVASMLKGDWGFSFVSRINVEQLILQRLPTTIIVIGLSQVLALLVALPVGVLAAVKPYSWFDRIASTLGGGAYLNLTARPARPQRCTSTASIMSGSSARKARALGARAAQVGSRVKRKGLPSETAFRDRS